MKYHLVIALSLCSFNLFSQQRGVTPLDTQNSKLETSNHPKASSAQTYAVVVGISDYQDQGIPDLRFAYK